MRNKTQKIIALFDTQSKQRVHPKASRVRQRSKSVPSKDHGHHKEDVIEVVKETAWDGVRYLGSEKKGTRLLWMIIILMFIVMSSIQIYFQVKHYMDEPVSTNIEVEFPQKIAFPTIAICNNNQYRLSYLVRKLNSTKSQPINGILKSVNSTSQHPFDQVIIRNADQDVVRFLTDASHDISDLVMRCVLPDGTVCSHKDFKPFWTFDGLCFEFNTDRYNPMEVHGSGNLYGLRLLLNLESYERVESKHKHFRSNSLPGLTVFVFNQTDIPHTASDRLNIPPGFTSYLPIEIKEMSKLPRSGCQIESDESKEAFENDFISPVNIRSCKLRKYLAHIDKECSCSMRGMFHYSVKESSQNETNTLLPRCTVDDYFGCVKDVAKKVADSGVANKCLPPCESMEFSGTQNLNRVPKNLIPKKQEKSDEDEFDRLRRDSPTPASDWGLLDEDEIDGEPTIRYVSITEPLDEDRGEDIMNKASFAIQSQYKYQDDLAAKFKRLIRRVSKARARLFAAKWGWDNADFLDVYTRMTAKHECVKTITYEYKASVSYLGNPYIRANSKKAELLYAMIDPEEWKRNPTKYGTTAEVRNAYKEKAEIRRTEYMFLNDMSRAMWSVFEENNYSKNIVADLSRMDRMIEKAENFTSMEGLKQWADEMDTVDRRYFVGSEFDESWYKIIHNDLDKKMVKTIANVFKNYWPKFEAYKKKGNQVFETAAIITYAIGIPSEANTTRVARFYDDMEKCLREVNVTAVQMRNEYTSLYKKFMRSIGELWNVELKKVQEKFAFDEEFELQNFAMVNIYLNKMAIEKWSQEETYSFWSLASDVGGALGLFMGASLVSIIEIFLIGFHFGGRCFSRRVTKTVQVVEEYRERKKSRAAMQNTGVVVGTSRDPSAV